MGPEPKQKEDFNHPTHDTITGISVTKELRAEKRRLRKQPSLERALALGSDWPGFKTHLHSCSLWCPGKAGYGSLKSPTGKTDTVCPVPGGTHVSYRR